MASELQVMSDFEKVLVGAKINKPSAAEQQLLERWTGTPAVAKAYDALMDGRNVINLAKLIAPTNRTGRASLSPLAVGPINRSGHPLIGEAGESYTGLRSGTWTFRLGQRPRNLDETGTTMIPEVPSAVIPIGATKTDRKEMLVLFEADWRRQAVVPRPVDPALLRPVSGTLFEVVAIWDLTEIEAAAISTAIRISQ